ncbi:MAG: AGE family epimerase/isomerase [Mesorhizobium sp.]|uniref:AGE family epimerase/isomerase n=1 Tax=Mesorhizobium sp. TaxID=1871066 RepID=UPI000FE63FCA|nr:AGE family epimerase/isomerase [Mesorhizobium sp.]RWM18354.1 MAG: AGE family epimerase/isomerase [Mesorhizobium sp.]
MPEFSFTSSSPGAWRDAPWHRAWLTKQADILFDLFDPAAINPRGGFFDLDPTGKPLPGKAVRPIHTTARAVHCYVIASLLGRPGSDRMIDHGMQYLWHCHRDAKHGGYMWSLDDDGPKDTTKQGYGHAFVLLAASSAKLVGHPLADGMLADVTTTLNERFWEEQHGAIAEEFERDWAPTRGYRGQNSNMHLTEALMAAYEATAGQEYLRKAERIADLIINRRARECDFRVAEHFDEQWAIDRSYRAVNEMFRPSGTTPGHWLEWARLALQLWVLGGKKHDWMPEAAEMLFRRSVELAWDGTKGGFFYTLDWADKPSFRFKPWWPIAEAAGAASFLAEHRPSAFHEEWYRRIWNTIAEVYIDREHGGWFEELDEDLQPAHSLFVGKADLYHALQACLIPLYPAQGSLTNMIRQCYDASTAKASIDGDV